MGNCVSCFNGACPEEVPVTINENTYNIDSAALSIAVTKDSDTQATAVITSDIADFIAVDAYLIDNDSVPGVKTLSPPPVPGWIDHEIVLDASGSATIVFTNTGPTDTWYLVLKGINGVLVVSSEINIGA
jgi:hypothetical protein